MHQSGPLSGTQKRAHDDPRTSLGTDAEDVLRRAYFRDSFALALRLDVSLEDAIRHLERAFDIDLLRTDALRLVAAERIATHFDDVVIATACARGSSTAWTELEESMIPMLTRMCELRINEIDALLHASRYLTTVREHSRGDEIDAYAGTPRMQDYSGLHPLRTFLGGPLFSMLQDLIRDGFVVASRYAPSNERNSRRLKLVN